MLRSLTIITFIVVCLLVLLALVAVVQQSQPQFTTIEELRAYPQNHVGQFVLVRGKIVGNAPKRIDQPDATLAFTFYTGANISNDILVYTKCQLCVDELFMHTDMNSTEEIAIAGEWKVSQGGSYYLLMTKI